MKNLLITILACAISLGFMAGLVFLVTWIFDWPFAWQIVFKAWVVFFIINIFRKENKNEDNN